jgi:hypothetical protein
MSAGGCFFASRAILTSMTPNYEHYTVIIECTHLNSEFVSGISLLARGSTPECPREQEAFHSDIQD